MDPRNSLDQLQKEFKKGKIPYSLHGFYHGEVSLLIPNNLAESLGSFLLRLYLPWKGKYFYRRSGDNIISSPLKLFLSLASQKIRYIRNGISGYHAFPFRTFIKKGIMDKKNVLELDYNLPRNPDMVRKVIDEIVEVGDNAYLGRAYIKENETYRLAAFLRLYKKS